MKNLNIGIISSAGGSAFQRMYECARESAATHRFSVVTDRACGIEPYCHANGIGLRRIEDPSNRGFTRFAAQHFAAQGVDFVLMFYTRLVTKELFSAMPVLNVHPALLPAFRGIRPLSRARESGVRFLGTTLHLVDEQVDAGIIVAQACMPVLPDELGNRLPKYSYIQKAGLAILLLDLTEHDRLRFGSNSDGFEMSDDVSANDRCCPCVTNPKYVAFLQRMQAAEGVRVL